MVQDRTKDRIAEFGPFVKVVVDKLMVSLFKKLDLIEFSGQFPIS